jgi:hypothetical protein
LPPALHYPYLAGCLLLFTLHSPYLQSTWLSPAIHSLYSIYLLHLTSSLFLSTWLPSALHSSLSLSTIYMVASCYPLYLQYLLYLVPLTLHSPSVSTWCLLLFTLHSPYLQATWLPPAIHSLYIIYCTLCLFTLRIYLVIFCSSLFTLLIYNLHDCLLLFTHSTVYIYLVPLSLHYSYLPGCVLFLTILILIIPPMPLSHP